MLYRINHTTIYEYSEAASLCQNLAHLTPRNTAYQTCRATALAIDPEPAVTSSRGDYFGNQMTFFGVQERHLQLRVDAKHLVDVEKPPIPAAPETPTWEMIRDMLRVDRSPAALDASQFVFSSRGVTTHSDLADYAAASFPAGRPVLEAALDLTNRI